MNITGDSGQNSFNETEFEEKEGRFVVAYEDNVAVACGSIRPFDHERCEIKRMYSKKSGFASCVLKELEKKARLLGFSKLVLSTRRINGKAVRFYLRNGFSEIVPYGRYRNRDESICLAKVI